MKAERIGPNISRPASVTDEFVCLLRVAVLECTERLSFARTTDTIIRGEEIDAIAIALVTTWLRDDPPIDLSRTIVELQSGFMDEAKHLAEYEYEIVECDREKVIDAEDPAPDGHCEILRAWGSSKGLHVRTTAIGEHARLWGVTLAMVIKHEYRVMMTEGRDCDFPEFFEEAVSEVMGIDVKTFDKLGIKPKKSMPKWKH